LKSGSFAASRRKLRDFDNHPGADAPPLLEKEGNVHLNDFMRKALEVTSSPQLLFKSQKSLAKMKVTSRGWR
jgi:hypothetical protein